MVNSLLIACYEWFCVFEPLEMSILYHLWHFFSFQHEKWQRNQFEMVWNSFYQLDKRYFQLLAKFEWLINYLFLVMNHFLILSPLKCQVCRNFDIFFVFNIKSKNEKCFKLAWRYFIFYIQGIFTYLKSLSG